MKDFIYKRSPYFIKVFLLNLKAYFNYKTRYGAKYKRYLAGYLRQWEYGRIEISKIQQNELTKLLLECFDYTTIYRQRFNDLGITRDEIQQHPFDVLNKMPLLSKMDRRAHTLQIINTNPRRPVTEVGYTSGSSGSPTKIFFDDESIEKSFALWTRFHRIIGIRKHDRSVRLSGRILINPRSTKPPFWINNYFEKQLLMSSYHLTEENMPHYINKLNQHKPHLIDGYPSAIYIIALFINKNNLKLHFNPTAIATTAETLYPHQRLEMEKAFNCKVYNQYASSEGVPLITECKEGKLHINEDSGIFEFLDNKNEPAGPGQVARLVTTSFRNLKTPLIRYDIEDMVLLSDDKEKCLCGCVMPTVENIIGREDDILWTPEKGYVGRMDTAYKGIEGIIKSQIIQISPNDLIVNNIVDNTFKESMRLIFLKNLKERLGEAIRIEINTVDDIPLGANGKFVAVKRTFSIKDYVDTESLY